MMWGMTPYDCPACGAADCMCSCLEELRRWNEGRRVVDEDDVAEAQDCVSPEGNQIGLIGRLKRWWRGSSTSATTSGT